MLQRISLTTADGKELFSGISLLRSEPPPPPDPAEAASHDPEASPAKEEGESDESRPRRASYTRLRASAAI